jgi:ribosomal protein S18 acetylase RimI-like enzyme
VLRPLPRDAGPLLDPLTAPLVRQFPDAAAFLDWQAGLEAAIATGRITGLATDAFEAVLLYQEQDGLATILAGLGQTSDAFLEACLDHLQGRLDALIWDAWVGPDWADRLAHRGVRPYELVTSVQEVARVPAAPVASGIRPWRPEDADEVAPLLVAANAGTLAGLFLTYPAAPTPAAYAGALARLLAGEEGAFMPEASHVALVDGRIASVLLAVRRGPTTGCLYELATHPAARGRGLGRQLVEAMQASLRELGLPHLSFITTADNAPLHRLYLPETIIERSTTRGGYWLRGT